MSTHSNLEPDQERQLRDLVDEIATMRRLMSEDWAAFEAAGPDDKGAVERIEYLAGQYLKGVALRWLQIQDLVDRADVPDPFGDLPFELSVVGVTVNPRERNKQRQTARAAARERRALQPLTTTERADSDLLSARARLLCDAFEAFAEPIQATMRTMTPAEVERMAAFRAAREDIEAALSGLGTDDAAAEPTGEVG